MVFGATFSRRPFDRSHVALPTLDDRSDVVDPQRQGLRPLGGVLSAVIDAGDAPLMPADMVQHGLNDVRLHPKIGHPGCGRAAQVMQGPVREGLAPAGLLDPLVQSLLRS